MEPPHSATSFGGQRADPTVGAQNPLLPGYTNHNDDGKTGTLEASVIRLQADGNFTHVNTAAAIEMETSGFQAAMKKVRAAQTPAATLSVSVFVDREGGGQRDRDRHTKAERPMERLADRKTNRQD